MKELVMDCSTRYGLPLYDLILFVINWGDLVDNHDLNLYAITAYAT